MKTKVFLFATMMVLTAGSGMALVKSSSFVQDVTLYSTRTPTGFGYYYAVKDAAFFVFNPNANDLIIEASLEAVGDPGFVFVDGSTGTLEFTDLRIKGYADCRQNTGFLGYSYFGFAIAFDKLFPSKTFRLRVSSQSGQPFYLYGPSEGFWASGALIGSWVSTYHAAWQAFDRYIPVTWDSGIQRYVVPFVDMWHRTSDYPVGWQSVVTLTEVLTGPNSESFASTTRTIYNQNQSGGHGHDPQQPIPGHGCCSTPGAYCGVCGGTGGAPHSFSTMCRTVGAFDYNQPLDVYRFHVVGDVRSQHDGQVTITGYASNLIVSARVYPNSGGTACPSVCAP